MHSSSNFTESQIIRTGMWTREEHLRYLQAMRVLRGHRWKTIAAYIGTRSDRQVLSHHQKFLRRCRRIASRSGSRMDHLVDSRVYQSVSGQSDGQSCSFLSKAEVATTDWFIRGWSFDDNEELDEAVLAIMTNEVDGGLLDDLPQLEDEVQQILNANNLHELRVICGL